MTVHVHFSTPPRPGILLIGVVVFLLIAAGVVAYVGTHEHVAFGPDLAPEIPSADGTIVHIDLPQETFPAPWGENRELFVRSCTQCHSPRLVFTQPRFPAKKWATVVTKMVNAHKAALTPDEQNRIIVYLSSVHGE